MIFKLLLFYESLSKSGSVIIWLVNVQSVSVDEAALAACKNIGCSSESTLEIFLGGSNSSFLFHYDFFSIFEDGGNI